MFGLILVVRVLSYFVVLSSTQFQAASLLYGSPATTDSRHDEDLPISSKTSKVAFSGVYQPDIRAQPEDMAGTFFMATSTLLETLLPLVENKEYQRPPYTEVAAFMPIVRRSHCSNCVGFMTRDYLDYFVESLGSSFAEIRPHQREAAHFLSKSLRKTVSRLRMICTSADSDIDSDSGKKSSGAGSGSGRRRGLRAGAAASAGADVDLPASFFDKEEEEGHRRHHRRRHIDPLPPSSSSSGGSGDGSSSSSMVLDGEFHDVLSSSSSTSSPSSSSHSEHGAGAGADNFGSLGLDNHHHQLEQQQHRRRANQNQTVAVLVFNGDLHHHVSRRLKTLFFEASFWSVRRYFRTVVAMVHSQEDAVTLRGLRLPLLLIVNLDVHRAGGGGGGGGGGLHAGGAAAAVPVSSAVNVFLQQHYQQQQQHLHSNGAGAGVWPFGVPSAGAGGAGGGGVASADAEVVAALSSPEGYRPPRSSQELHGQLIKRAIHETALLLRDSPLLSSFRFCHFMLGDQVLHGRRLEDLYHVLEVPSPASASASVMASSAGASTRPSVGSGSSSSNPAAAGGGVQGQFLLVPHRMQVRWLCVRYH
jgi:hypothetical protein